MKTDNMEQTSFFKERNTSPCNHSESDRKRNLIYENLVKQEKHARMYYSYFSSRMRSLLRFLLVSYQLFELSSDFHRTGNPDYSHIKNGEE
jgi:hypothetical protein